ncbi:enolase C-terminal domain-like protein [Ascobolus immersus RN42]|uniref:Enolase C-terminal domain-like protein n=1 Tax=Ascobolus immersus RN42 TaxID=1160509 RepID=A0A3N4HR53_ASCIM|nr:enolase C-terminal domain-like protein [Ascobolus immersus RN42]
MDEHQITNASSISNAEIIICRVQTKDVRFPTSLSKLGSDAMNEAGDYSTAYCMLHTNIPDPEDPRICGHGMTFTIGRGNELVCHAIELLARPLVGRSLSSLTRNMGATWRWLVSDSQLRWIGPEKGVMHLALGAVVNAIWDLWAKAEGKPLWKLVADMDVEAIVNLIDFRYIDDVLTPDDVRQIWNETRFGWEQRLAEVNLDRGVQAYTTSAGWLGYSDIKMTALLTEAKDAGYTHFKLKVGGSIEEDKRRLRIARQVLGNSGVLMVDANQVWGVNQAIEYMKELAEFKPYFIEEPTSPDDILGHGTIREALKPYGIKVATGEMVHNRVMFKQLLQNGSIDILQPDACRVGGFNEVLTILLMARKFRVPCIPHSGGVGLPELTRHMSIVDYLVVSGERNLLEMVEGLNDRFVEPAQVVDGFFKTPRIPGYLVGMKKESMEMFDFRGNGFWRTEEAQPILRSHPRDPGPDGPTYED